MSPRAKVLLPFFLILLVVAGYVRLGRHRDEGGADQLLSLAGRTMGTTYKVLAVPGGAEDYPWLKRRVQAELNRVEALMSTYQSDSEVSRFNASADEGPFALSTDTMAVVRAAQEIGEQSRGAFDISVGPLVALWGFGAGAKIERPTAQQLATARSKVGVHRLELSEAGLTKASADMEIDLSAIAKGYGADRVVEVLRKTGLEHFMVEVGGEVVVRGEKAAGVPWRIGIEQPVDGTRIVRRVVEMTDGALATSGDYRNFYEENGRRISHTIDPRTGQPIAHRLASVSVFHSSAMMADGYATAISVLGPQEGLRFAAEQKLAAHLLVREVDGTFTARSTPAFEQLFPPSEKEVQ